MVTDSIKKLLSQQILEKIKSHGQGASGTFRAMQKAKSKANTKISRSPENLNNNIFTRIQISFM